MSYIGRGIDSIDNISTLDNLSFNGSDATFNLTQNSVAFVPVSADALQIQIDGVIQANNFTISGSTLTFDFVPSGSSVCNSVKHFGVGLLTTVSDSSITTAKLGADSVNGSKIADDSISDEHLDITAITGQTAITSLADTDKFLVSDASDSGNLKYVEKQYLPNPTPYYNQLSNITISNGDSYAEIQNVFTSTYLNYRIVLNNIGVVTNSADLQLITMTSDGSTPSNHSYGANYIDGSSYSNRYGGVNSSNITIMQGQASGTGTYVTGVFDIFNANTTTTNGIGFYWMARGRHHSSGHGVVYGGGAVETSTARTGFKVKCNSGNLAGGTITTYGITNPS